MGFFPSPRCEYQPCLFSCVLFIMLTFSFVLSLIIISSLSTHWFYFSRCFLPSYWISWKPFPNLECQPSLPLIDFFDSCVCDFGVFTQLIQVIHPRLGAQNRQLAQTGLFLEGTISWWCPGFLESWWLLPFFLLGGLGWGMGNQGPLTPWSPEDAFRGFSGHWECLYVKDYSLLILVLLLNFISQIRP